MDMVICNVQSSLLFLYYVVVFSVISVQYCLCVSRIYCIQCQCRSISSDRYIAFNASSVQSIASVQFLKRSVCRVQSVAYIVNGVQCQLGYSQRRSWSAYYYSVS